MRSFVTQLTSTSEQGSVGPFLDTVVLYYSFQTKYRVAQLRKLSLCETKNKMASTVQSVSRWCTPRKRFRPPKQHAVDITIEFLASNEVTTNSVNRIHKLQGERLLAPFPNVQNWHATLTAGNEELEFRIRRQFCVNMIISLRKLVSPAVRIQKIECSYWTP